MTTSNPARIHQIILKELSDTLEKSSGDEIENLCRAIASAKRLFICGAGRTGLIMKCFAMRLMQIGLQVWVVGETTTPSINEYDLLIIGSGSGETESILSIVEKARTMGIKTAVFTIFPDSSIGKGADILVQIFAPSLKSKMVSSAISRQPLGNLFESSLLLVTDGIVMQLMTMLQIDQSMMFSRHANLE